MQESSTHGVKFEDQYSVVITLDQLESGEIPDDFWKSNGIVKLKIRKTTSKTSWVSYPPLSWYETRVLKAPYWKIPEKIGRFKDLKSLRLVDLDISQLPNSITLLQKLEVLDLSLNKLQISNELAKFKELKGLKLLRVQGNHFQKEEVQKFIKEFPQMQVEYGHEND